MVYESSFECLECEAYHKMWVIMDADMQVS